MAQSKTNSSTDSMPFRDISASDGPSDSKTVYIDMLRSEVTQLHMGQQSASALDLPSQAVREIKRKITLDDYKRQKALANFGARAKDIVFGFDRTQSAFCYFGDLD
ncbi:hypothetical protein IFR05_017078 [Cadophora sp. M221]|nr:hypothetical protein IFR05_017078 [Cadophora sp. M221]